MKLYHHIHQKKRMNNYQHSCSEFVYDGTYKICIDCGLCDVDNIDQNINKFEQLCYKYIQKYSRRGYLKKKMRFKLGLQRVVIPKALMYVCKGLSVREIKKVCRMNRPYRKWIRHADKIRIESNGLPKLLFPEKLYVHLCYFLMGYEYRLNASGEKRITINLNFFCLRVMRWMYEWCNPLLLGYNPMYYKNLFRRSKCKQTYKSNTAKFNSVSLDDIKENFLSLYSK